jgi:hypothetical protein
MEVALITLEAEVRRLRDRLEPAPVEAVSYSSFPVFWTFADFK